MINQSLRRVGFTLVELLVVVAILALLATMLLPALPLAREKSRQVVCVNNLKQMGTAIRMYANDNGGWMPLTDVMVYVYLPFNRPTWIGAIHPYIDGQAFTCTHISNVFICPSGKSENFVSTSGWNNVNMGGLGVGGNYMYSSYLGQADAISWCIGQGNPPAGVNVQYGARQLDKCLKPSSCAIVIDGKNKTCNGSVDYYDVEAAKDVARFADPRHNGGINVLFADGHAGWDDPLQQGNAEIVNTYFWNKLAWWPQ